MNLERFYFYLFCFVHFASSNDELSKNFNFEFTKTEKIYECLSKMSENITDNNILVISSYSILNFPGLQRRYSNPTVLVTENSTAVLIKLERIDLFILSFLTVEEFSYWLKSVYLLQFWNPHGLFIISILNHDNVTAIFEEAWRYYIININVLSYSKNILGVYTYYPYKSSSCATNFTENLLFLCSQTVPKILFTEKVPKKFNGCEMKVFAFPTPPYVIDYLANAKNPKEVGFEVTIFDTILTKLNLKQLFIKHNYPSWGSKLENGTYTLMFNELLKKNADLMYGRAYLLPNSTEFEVLSQSVSDVVAWWVPSANLRPPWTNILYVYSPLLSIFVICSVIINGFTWWIFGKYKEQIHIFKYLHTCIISSLYVYLQGTIKSPKTNPLRILLAFWLIVSLVLYVSLQSQLISTLTNPKSSYQISTVEEIMDSELLFGFFPAAAGLYAHPTDPVDIKIRTSFLPCKLDAGCSNRTAFKRDFAVLTGRRQILYRMPKTYLFPDGRPMLYGFGQGALVYSKYILLKGNPVIKRMDRILGSLFSNGLINKWEDDVSFTTNSYIKPELTSLSLEHIAVGFLYLLIGIILSTIVFIIEIICRKCKCKYK